ncbi:hypothetical protein [Actinokineospora enzanensis]|uniref:hypothetical protein n=1 Tax=Actinokineospora enzanensis TaxID=155975 RepID=UPI0003724895|nr:hypothetical protein [Actinokineospora enzanensis]
MARVSEATVEVRGPVNQFRTFFREHWVRGAAGTETPEWVWRFAYRTWVLALVFKLLGSSWDESWHFKFLRDDLAPPHLINTVGTGIAIVLVAIHTFTGMAATRRSLRLLQSGLAVFLIAAPLDVINHRVNGLDLTAWSPSHALLYAGTALMIAGLIDGWYAAGPRGRGWTVMLGALWVFFLENTVFPNGQQEYGALEMRSCLPNGVLTPDSCYAERELLEFAANQIGRPVDYAAIEHFALPIPPWVYPLWGIGVGALVLVLAAKTVKHPWAATMIAGAYVAYRAVVWPLLVAADFPPSAVPFYLLFVGLAIDLVRRAKLSSIPELLATAAAAVAIGYAALYLQDRMLAAPPTAWWSAPIALVGVAAIWFAARPVQRRFSVR